MSHTSHDNIAFLDHYPKMAEFKKLSRSEVVESFAPIHTVGASHFPHPNYFFHIHPWDPHFGATESNRPLRFPSKSFTKTSRHQPAQTSSWPLGWIFLAIIIFIALLKTSGLKK